MADNSNLGPDRETVLAALDRVTDPRSGRGIVTAGLIKGLVVAPGKAGCMIEVGAQDAALYAPVRDAVEAALRAATGAERVHVALTAEAETATPPRRGASLSPAALEQNRPKAPVAAERPAHVRCVLAVASGKGGVGKSTVAVNLACAFARLGLSAGLLDADVYGPSAPTMLGLSGQPDYVDGAIAPPVAFGIKAMSTGLLVAPDQAMIWRGPMASQALTQMLTQVRWGTAEAPLDVLVVDLPPGTGDVHLTLVQKTPLDGVVIVSTPQEVALADARRAHAMFGKIGAPVLGLIENMSFLPNPVGGEPIDLFGRGGAQAEAGRLGTPFLGEIPLDPALRIGGDQGRPLVAVDPEGETAGLFMVMAGVLRARLLG